MPSFLRRVLDLIGPRRRRRFVLVGILSTIVSGLEAVSAALVLVILRLVLEPGEVPDLPLVGDVTRFLPGVDYEQFVVIAAVAFGIFFVTRGALFLFSQYAAAKVAENTGLLLANRLVDGYLSMPYTFHLRRNSAELIRNAYDNVQQIVNGIFRPVTYLIADVSMIVAMLVALVLVSPLMTLAAAVVMGAAVAITLAIIQPQIRQRGRQRQQAARTTLQQLQQGFGGIRDVKVLGREATFARSFFGARRQMAEAEYRRAALSHVPRFMLETGFLLFILIALTVAVTRAAASSVLSTLGVFAYAGLRLQPSLQRIAQAANTMRYAEAAVEDIAGDLAALDRAAAERAADDTDPEPLPVTRALTLRGVHFRYEGAEIDALAGVDLEIRRGESIGIAGPTGSGKSTLLDMICGLITSTSGQVLVDGGDLTGRVRAWQRSLGVVHQTSFLIDDTLRRNIALGVRDGEIDDHLIADCARIAQLEGVVAELPEGLDTLVGERGVRLSGGQRQRVTLARALYRKPSVLILDEGTAALDNETERAVLESLEELGGDVTLIIVAHRLTSMERCDRLIYVEHGRVCATGSFDDFAVADG